MRLTRQLSSMTATSMIGLLLAAATPAMAARPPSPSTVEAPAHNPQSEPEGVAVGSSIRPPSNAFQIEKDRLISLRINAATTGSWAAYELALSQFNARYGRGRDQVTSRAPVTAAGSVFRILIVPHTPQEATNWCAPASGVMLMKSVRYYHGTPAAPTQQVMASRMGTGDPGGDGTSIENVDVALNQSMKGSRYGLLMNLRAAGWTKVYNTIATDIDANFALVVNAWERSGTTSPRYNGHPVRTAEIKHYLTVSGYSTDGRLRFSDPAANTTVLGAKWSNVKPSFDAVGQTFYTNFLNDPSRGLVY